MPQGSTADRRIWEPTYGSPWILHTNRLTPDENCGFRLMVNARIGAS